MKVHQLLLVIIAVHCLTPLLIANSPPHDVTTTQFWQKHFQNKNTLNYPVVFVHGINARLSDWEKTASLLSNDNYCTVTYHKKDTIKINKRGNTHCTIWNICYYEPNLVKEMLIGDLKRYSLRLDAIIALIKQESQQNKVIIIAHSMGGLVARSYMSHTKASWNSVYKILTVGTPHEGVPIAPPIINHLRDLHPKSIFIKNLNNHWQAPLNKGYKQWGVIGAVNIKKISSTPSIKASSTDSGGPGYIPISSSIPFGEWQAAIKQPNIPSLNTPHFGYRLFTNAKHDDLLFHEAVLKAIIWATTN